MVSVRRSAFVLLVAAVGIAAPSAQQRPGPSPDQYRRLHWRNIGPEGNRFSAAAGIAGDPHTYYVGAASGGIWKTTDGGTNWTPIFDDQPVQSIGSLAVAPSDPNVVWAGTGEAQIRSHISLGQGVYKSTDAGKTWTLMGLEQTGRIPRTRHPPDKSRHRARLRARSRLRAAAGARRLPHHRRRRDLDESRCSSTRTPAAPTSRWIRQEPAHAVRRHVAARDPHVGTHERRPGQRAVHVARRRRDVDSACTGRGLPDEAGRQGRRGDRAVESASRLRAHRDRRRRSRGTAQDTESGQLWRSDDGGENWALDQRRPQRHGPRALLLAHGRRAGQSRRDVFPHRVVREIDRRRHDASPCCSAARAGARAAIITTSGSIRRTRIARSSRTIRGCRSRRTAARRGTGSACSTRRSTTSRWTTRFPTTSSATSRTSRPIADRATAALQGGFGGDAGIPRGMWHSVGGGESGWATPDPDDSNIVWSTASGSGMVGGIVVRFEEDRRQFRNVEVWPQQSNGPAEGVQYRFVWDAPLHISPHDNNTIYVGSQHVHRTTQRRAELAGDLPGSHAQRQDRA